MVLLSTKTFLGIPFSLALAGLGFTGAFFCKSDCRAQAAGIVVVNLLPAEETMKLQLNNATLGDMVSGTATGPLPLRTGVNQVRLVWGQTNKAEGTVTVKPGETAIAVAYQKVGKPLSPYPASITNQPASPFHILALNSGLKVAKPQFYIFSSLMQSTNLQVDGKATTIDPGIEARVGSEDRIKIQYGENGLLELDGTPPACLDGPMKWFLFLFQKPNQKETKIIPLADFAYLWSKSPP